MPAGALPSGDADVADAGGRIILGYRVDPPATLPGYALALGGREVLRNDAVDFVVVEVDSEDTASLLEAARSDPALRYAERDGYVHALFSPNDLLYAPLGIPLQWGPPALRLPEAWDLTLGNPGVQIHVLDTGVDLTHADLALNVCDPGADFVTNPFGLGPGLESGFHGTHVAGIAAAQTNNLIGVAGTSQSCIVPVRVLVVLVGLWSWLASGITWSADHGARIISMSLGGCCPEQAVQDAVSYAFGKGVLMVAAAGNDDCGDVLYPAVYTEVMAVGALETPWDPASFSNCGPQLDVAAPGVGIWSTLPGQTYGLLDGTSMATPFVSGTAALMFARNPGLTAAQAFCILQHTAVDIVGAGFDWNTGFGRVDAFSAVVAGDQPAAVGC